MAEESEVKFSSWSKMNEQEQVKHLKRLLEGWREILLPIHSFLTWDKPFYPGLIAGSLTFLFIMIWYVDPSLLTSLSLLGMLACIADYLVPVVSPKIFDPNKWTGSEEKKFEEICQSIVSVYLSFFTSLDSFFQMKKKNPRLFFVLALVGLSLSAWIGNVVDNLFLTYLIVLGAVMMPGLKRHGILEKYVGQGILTLQKLMGHKSKAH